MCPLCIGTAGWLALGTVSAGGIGTLLKRRQRKGVAMATMTRTHALASREEWLKARLDLLKKEKELTRRSDEVAVQRQALPWVRVEKNYRFEMHAGELGLKDLFRGRSQLLVYHLMFGPDYKAPCPSCSMIADGFNGFWEHLATIRDALGDLAGPAGKTRGAQEEDGLELSLGLVFLGAIYFDYGVGFTEAQQSEGYEYNFQERVSISDARAGRGFAAMCGVSLPTFLREMPGMSAFVLEDRRGCHSYSTYARASTLWGAYQWLDRAPLGRNEGDGVWWKRRDEYGAL